MYFARYLCCLLSSGLGRTGVFCALSICLERVKADGVLDVYQAVKAMRIQRPQLVRTVVSSVTIVVGFCTVKKR